MRLLFKVYNPDISSLVGGRSSIHVPIMVYLEEPAYRQWTCFDIITPGIYVENDDGESTAITENAAFTLSGPPTSGSTGALTFNTANTQQITSQDFYIIFFKFTFTSASGLFLN
jgi:hypothetical protein